MAATKAFALIMVIIVVSFLGFCVENVFISLNHGFVDNRNMVLPFLLGYGLAILAYYLLFGTPQNPLFFGTPISFSTSLKSTLYCFVISFIGVSIGEIILGYATEWCCGIVWWNYSQIPMHITKYTSVPTSLAFATLITVFMKYMFSPLISLFSKINPEILGFLSVLLLFLLSLDAINSALYMFKNHSTLNIWRFNINNISELMSKRRQQ